MTDTVLAYANAGYDWITELNNDLSITAKRLGTAIFLRDKDGCLFNFENVKKAKNTVQENMPIDIIAIFIKDIQEDLGNITGEVVTDDIINEIFSNINSVKRKILKGENAFQYFSKLYGLRTLELFGINEIDSANIILK